MVLIVVAKISSAMKLSLEKMVDEKKVRLFFSSTIFSRDDRCDVSQSDYNGIEAISKANGFGSKVKMPS